MRVLICTDGSEFSYEAARQFIRLTHGTRHDILALYVMPLLTIGRNTSYLEIQEEREGRAALNAVKNIFDEVAIPIKIEIRQGIPAETIIQVAHEGKFDLIVIGHKGKGGFREFLLGSVSKHIVQNAPCSVLVGR
ncbi:MAG: universal stress protein [Armatimonadota bacterium]|nr:universal stress protein [Armatimonadota bacterium]